MPYFLIPLLAQAAKTDPLVDTGISFGWLFVKTILAMVVVIALALVLIRFILPKFRWSSRGYASRIKILDRFGLEHRKGLFIIQVGKKTALIGTSDHQVNKLMDLDPEDLENESKK